MDAPLPEGIVLRLLAEESPDAVLLLDDALTIRYAGPRCEAVLGVGAARLDGTLATRWIHPANAEEVRASLEAIQPGEATVQTFRLARPGGSPRWIEGIARGLPEGPVHAIWSLRDVSCRFIGEGRLTEIEAILAQATVPVLILTAELQPDGPTIRFANAAFTAMTGYEPDEVHGASIRLLEGPRTDSAAVRRLHKRLRQGRMFQGELVNYRRDGTPFVVEWSLAPLRDASGTIIDWVAMQRDRTEHRRMEKVVLEAAEREQRRIAQQLHDSLAQHLTGIAFFLRTVAEDLSDAGRPESERGLVQEAIVETSHLSRGLFPGHPGTDGLAMALRELALQAEQRYRFRVDLALDHDIHVTDETTTVYLYRIAQEAVVNAARHARPSVLTVRLESADGLARLVVADDGPGISEGAAAGGGLGIRIMRYRANLVGAQLDVGASEAGGTEVRCTFDPAAAAML